MNARVRTLPLGIDLGRRRVRVALTECAPGGEARLIAVAARDHDGDAPGALAAALGELSTAERRCVVALGAPDARLCSIVLPPMRPWERARAARFEAARFVGYPVRDATVTLVPAAAGTGWTAGIAHRAALEATLAAARALRLRPVAVDDAALALRRVHPDAGSIVDIGAAATRVCTYGRGIPQTALVPIGGDHLTGAIAQSLGIDVVAAERRKRSTGFGGAGEGERDRLVAAIADAIAAARGSGDAGGETIVLCGNGARVPQLAAVLAAATGAPVTPAHLAAGCSDTVPADVLRAAGPDWSTAVGLSVWSLAA